MRVSRFGTRGCFFAALIAVFSLTTAVSAQDYFMVPERLAGQLPPGSEVLHEYENRLLVAMPSERLGQALRPQVSELEDTRYLSYRNWRGRTAGHEADSLPELADGYFLLALVGPMDERWRARIESHGLSVVDHVNPYGALVRGSSRSVQAAARDVMTSRQQPVITHAMVLPEASRVAEDVSLWMSGRGTAESLGLRTEGDLTLVQIVLHADAAPDAVNARVMNHLQPGPEFVAGRGWAQYTASPQDVSDLLAQVPEVAFVHGVYPKEQHNNISAQPNLTNVQTVWEDLNYTGAGVIAGVNDSGLDLSHADFPSSAVVATLGAMSDTDNGHGTHVTGTVAGRGAHPAPTNTSSCGDVTAPLPDARGVAWEAQVTHNNIFDGGSSDEASMMQWQFEQGAAVVNNSWGYGSIFGPATDYGVETVAVDAAVRDALPGNGFNNQLGIVFSAGNSAASGVGKPGNGKNVITVGASQNDRCGSYVPSQCAGPDIDGMACFSSHGPSQGRAKPDIVAPGTDILSSGSSDPQATWGGWDQPWTGPEFAILPGTSMSAPQVTGASAIFHQFYDDVFSATPSPALIKAALINTATHLSTASYPSNIEGWGRMNLPKALEGPVEDGIVYFDQDDVDHLTTGDSWTAEIGVSSSDVPLRFTLVWTDPPGAAGCSACHVNDLDLIVTAPDGTVYRGNQFSGIWSAADATGRDGVNNVENVYIENPETGTWMVEVNAFNVAQNPSLLNGQDYALVVTGDFGGFSVEPAQASVCAADGQIDFTLTLSSQYQGTTNLSAAGEPAGTTGVFNPEPVVFPIEESVYTLSGLAGATGGDYTLDFTATDAADPDITATNSATLTIYEDNPAQVMLQTPADAATNIDLQPEFMWDAATEAAGYQIQVATDSGFSDIVIDEDVAQTSLIPTEALATGTDYFWRVRANNTCGDGNWSATFEFQTRFEPVIDVDVDALELAANFGDTDSDTLEITNVGTGVLTWEIDTDVIESILGASARGHEPALDEAFQIPDFSLASGQDFVEFTRPAGVATRGDVVGFSFEGFAEPNSNWASDTCLIIDAPDGTRYSVGGFSSSIDHCGTANHDAPWDFQGAGSTNADTYTSTHDDAFETALGDQGDWTFTFIHAYAAGTTPIEWSDVTLTLHKQPLPVCFEEPYADVPWLNVSPDSGNTGAGQADTVTVTADAGSLADGVHHAWLCVASNDADNPLVVVPVEFTVTDPDAATLQGAVTGLGYCSADPQPLVGATVTIEGANGTYTTTTGADGGYFIRINGSESPADFTVSANGYLSGTRTGVSFGAGDEVTNDFDLLADASCAEISPQSFEFGVAVGDSASDDLVLSNANGGIALDWELETEGSGDFACEDPADIGWLSVTPDSGSVGPGASATAAVTVDATDLADGTYEALLCVATNDGNVELTEVPVVLIVNDPELAIFDGTVIGHTCSTEPQPLAGAVITIAGATDTFTAETDEDGYYFIKVHQSQSPADISASFDGYVSQSVDGVVFQGLDEITNDFTLSFDAACIEVDPGEVAMALEMDQVAQATVEISNLGSQTLDWALFEPELGRNEDSGPLIGFDFSTTGSSDIPQNWTRIGTVSGSLEDVLDDSGEPTSIGIEWGGVTSDGPLYLATGTLADDAVPQYHYDLSGMTGYGFRASGHLFVELSGLTPNTDYEFWFVGYRAGSAIGNLVEVMDGSGNVHFEFLQEITAADNDSRFLINEEIGHADQDFGDLALVASSDANGVIRFEWTAPGPGTAVIGALAIREAIVCEIPDWLSVAPTSGSIEAGGASDTVTLTLNSEGLAPGEHEGNFCIDSNDPATPRVPVPVTLEVSIPDDYGMVEGMVTSLGHCNANPEPLVGALVEIVGATRTRLVETDASGFYQAWLHEDESPVDITVNADNHHADNGTASFVAGETGTADFELLLDEPCAEVGGAIAITLDQNVTASGEIELSNASGNATLSWQVDTATQQSWTGDESRDVFVAAARDASCEDIGSVPWLGANPVFGNLAAGAERAIDVNFDTTGMQPGEFEAALCVFSNDPVNPALAVPVHLTVRANAGHAVITGTVQTLGHCQANPAPLDDAMVMITSGAQTYQPAVNDDGVYSLSIPATEGPVDIAVSADGHIDGEAGGVALISGQTTEQDFDLVVEAACASADPNSIATTVATDGTVTETLTIGNLAGAVDLEWTLETAEMAAAPTPTASAELKPANVMMQAGHTAQSTGGVEDLASILGEPLPSMPVLSRSLLSRGMFDCDSTPGLIIQDDGTVENGYSGNAAAGVTAATFVDHFTPSVYPATFTGVCIGFITISGPTTYDIEIVAFADDGPGGTPGTELGAVSATVTVDQLSPPVPPDHPTVWNSIDISSMELAIESGGVYIGARWTPLASNVFISGDESGPNPPGFAGGYRQFDTDNIWEPILAGFEDYRALMVRPVEAPLGDCSVPEEVSWLSLDPNAGITAAGDSSEVQVIFDADGLPNGVYNTLLCLHSNDPVNPALAVPVTMTVEAPRPVADITPDAFEFEVPQGASAVDVLNMGNAGEAELSWSIAGAEGGRMRGEVVDLVEDGGFEAGSPNPSWVEFESSFDTPLCDSGCSQNPDFGPNSGAWWAWFGGNGSPTGDGLPTTGSLTQDVTFPGSGSAELRFWLQIPSSDQPGILEVSLGGDVVFSVSEADAGSYATYTEVVIDVSDYADGGTHELHFHSETQAGSGVTNFFLDDVSLLFQAGAGACEDPGDVAWLNVAPESGTTVAGDSVAVDVTVNTVDLAEGDYEAMLCVTTNDPDASLVEVPVFLTVTEAGEIGEGVLEVTPEDMGFGNVMIGQTATVGITVRNAAQPGATSLVLDLMLVTAGGHAFEIVEGSECVEGMALAPQQSCALQVGFTPAAQSEYTGTLMVMVDDGSQSVEVSLNGTGVTEEPDDDVIFGDRFEVASE